ncbi:FecR family protein [Caulobacter hibisci]|uniref:FecR domain-containing protein n=1 Tax=Caulobacter hibisci TaxID=2035993 RepID=A0ABS0T169_9CAUL|nr:FecR domain-containing protein [Caulobacter hibisci]MBI1685261.1 FecR domain-containing protein [Caulobacter hibisci]
MRHLAPNLASSGEPDAAEWVARLHNRPNDLSLRRDFDSWLKSDPANKPAFDSAADAWSRIGALSDEPEIRSARAALKADLAADARRRHARPQMRWAAGIAAMVMAGGFGTALWLAATSADHSAPAVAPAQMAEAVYQTGVGERKSITLADGSVATLSTDTVLRVTEWGARRGLTLDRGEAFFQVAKNPQRPFVVTAQGRTVTALGTAFNVRIDPGAWSVSLLEGKIRVADPAAHNSVDLLPGSRLEQHAGATWAVAAADVAALTSWREGSLVFDNQPLSQIVGELNRYSDRKIRIASPRVAATPMSGRFKTGDVGGFVDALSAYGAAKVRTGEGGEIVLVAP